MSRLTERKKFKFKNANNFYKKHLHYYDNDIVSKNLFNKLLDLEYFYLDIIVKSNDNAEIGHAMFVWGENYEYIDNGKDIIYPLLRNEIEKYFDEIAEIKEQVEFTHPDNKNGKYSVNVHPDDGKPFILGGEDSPYSYDEAISLVKDYFLSNYNSTRFDKVLMSKVENKFRRDDFELTLKSK